MRYFALLFLFFSIPIFSITPEELLDIAYKNSADILGQQSEIKKSDETYIQARGELFPKIDFQMSGTFLQNNLGSFNLFFSQIPGLSGMNSVLGNKTINKPISPEDHMYYDFAIKINQVVFSWGRIFAGMDLARIGQNINNQILEKKKRELEAKLYSNLISYYYLKKIYDEIFPAQLDVVERLVFISDKTNEAGLLDYFDTIRARDILKQITVYRIDLKQNLDLIAQEILYLVGVDDLDFSTIEFNIKEPDNILSDLPADFTSSVSNSPNYTITVENIKAKEKMYEITRGGSLGRPTIGLSVELGYGGSRFPLFEFDYINKDDYKFNISLGFSMKLTDGGISRSKEVVDAENLKIAKILSADVVRQLTKNINNYKINIDNNLARIDYYKDKIESGKKIIDKRKKLFDIGQSEENDLLHEKINSNFDMITLYKEYIDFFVNYYSLRSIIKE